MEHNHEVSGDSNLLTIARVLRDLADQIESAAVDGLVQATAKPNAAHLLEIDPGTLSVRWDGRKCVLGASIGFRLMQRLARRPGRYISHDELLTDVWQCCRSTSTVRSAVRDLRRRLVGSGMADLAARIDGTNRGHYALLLD